ncbi:thiamine phosphate phosphatase-like protein [Mercurialis annua]|uniref:thiamine phosphate phosphatase-like protein n=1 Tax=Mercurialis annua TaxID=3986 RepID=UPI00215E0166|nr:thiamine phosphate phosphatase-like protein [Mercurialis annua]
MARLVLVFDFDKTLIDWDSDNWVVEQLGVNDAFLRLLPTLPWNSLMDQMMMELHSRNKTVEDISECLKQIPIHPNIISAIQFAHASGSDLRIVSDANTFFIETILEHYGLMPYFSEIYTNPAYVDADNRLRISQYHHSKSFSHGCTICPPNMCKGLVIDKIRASISDGEGKCMIYVGDGTPDICATLKLGQGDFVMPREKFPLCEFISNNTTLIKADIQEWSDGEELGTRLLNLITTKVNITSDLPVVDCKSQTNLISTHDSYTINLGTSS